MMHQNFVAEKLIIKPTDNIKHFLYSCNLVYFNFLNVPEIARMTSSQVR